MAAHAHARQRFFERTLTLEKHAACLRGARRGEALRRAPSLAWESERSGSQAGVGGLSQSKSLAKLVSQYRKPRGFKASAGNHTHPLLQKTLLEKVRGFGPNTMALLTKLGLQTAYDFAIRPQAWAEKLPGKLGWALWGELRSEKLERAPVAADALDKTFSHNLFLRRGAVQQPAAEKRVEQQVEANDGAMRTPRRRREPGRAAAERVRPHPTLK